MKSIYKGLFIIALPAVPLLCYWPHGYLMHVTLPKQRSAHYITCFSPHGFMLYANNTSDNRMINSDWLQFSINNNTMHLAHMPLQQKSLWVDSHTQKISLGSFERTGSLFINTDNEIHSLSLIGNIKKLFYKNVYTYLYHALNIEKHLESLRAFVNVRHLNFWEQGSEHESLLTCLYTPTIIKVLLDKQPIEQASLRWELSAENAFIIYDPNNTALRLRIPESYLRIMYKKNSFYINGRKINTSGLIIKPLSDTTTYNNTSYHGVFILTKEKDAILCINGIDLESYVCSVLKSESWPGWPLEVNKSLAIVIRSYALAHICSAEKRYKSFHIKNTNMHQTYRGAHHAADIKKAVEQTKGLILLHNNNPILAMFDSCCGGIIPKYIEHYIDFCKAPYLARSYPCLYCKECKIYSWKAEYDLAVLEKHLYSGIYYYCAR